MVHPSHYHQFTLLPIISIRALTVLCIFHISYFVLMESALTLFLYPDFKKSKQFVSTTGQKIIYPTERGTKYNNPVSLGIFGSGEVCLFSKSLYSLLTQRSEIGRILEGWYLASKKRAM